MREYEKAIEQIFGELSNNKKPCSTAIIPQLSTETAVGFAVGHDENGKMVLEKIPSVTTVSQPKPTPLFHLPKPIRIICNDPTTIVFWDDGDKTVVRCDAGEPAYDDEGTVVGFVREPDTYTPEGGLSAAYIRKLFGSRSEFKRLLNIAEYPKPKKQKYDKFKQVTFDFGSQSEEQKDSEVVE